MVIPFLILLSASIIGFNHHIWLLKTFLWVYFSGAFANILTPEKIFFKWNFISKAHLSALNCKCSFLINMFQLAQRCDLS